jgi:hypothetical protein
LSPEKNGRLNDAEGNANPNEKARYKWRVDHNDKSTSQFDPGGTWSRTL